MNALQQFLAQLNTELGDNEELKEKLVNGFKAVQTTYDSTKERADKLGSKADDLAKLNKLIGSKLNIEEVNDDNISEAITTLSKSKNEDIEAVKAELATKHESDLEVMRAELATKDEAFNSLNGKYNDTLFKTSVLDSGLLDGFVDEPEARNMIIGKLKPNFIFEDGKIFVNDGSGEKAKDITSGEYLSPKSVVETLKTSISPMYLKPDGNGGGSGTPPSNQPNNGGQTIDPTKFRDSGSFIDEAMSQIQS